MAVYTINVVQDAGTKENGTRLIMLRATINRKHKHAGTGISLPKKDFNPKGTFEKANWVRASHELAETYNKSIKNKIKAVHKKAEEYEKKGALITLELLQKIMKGKDADSFTQFYADFAEQYNPESEENIKKKFLDKGGLYDKHKATSNKLLQFTNNREIQFTELTILFIEKLEKWLMTDYRPLGKDGKPKKGGKPNSRNTTSRTLGFLKTAIRAAVKAGHINPLADPFLNFELKKQKVKKKGLKKNELDAFRDYPVPTHLRAWHSRNVFFFQYYVVGSRIGDMLILRWPNLILEIKNGVIVAGRVFFTMQKTENARNYKLSAQAIEILNIYFPTRDPNGFVFPFLKNDVDYSNPRFLQKQIESRTTCINMDLDNWSKKAGIDMKVTTHIARHSFSNNARRAKIDIYDISKMLGHSDIKTTQIYMEDFDEDEIDDAQEKIYGM